MTNRSLSALLVSLGTAMLLAACGGDGDSGPSRAEFAKNADGVCADVNKELKSLGQIDPNNATELASLIGQIKSRVNEGVDRLQALDRPTGDDGKTAEEFVTALHHEMQQQAIPALDQLVSAAKERDQVKLRAAVRKLDALTKTPSDALAQKLGAAKCAED